MSHPLYHAISSKNKFSGEIDDYLPIHNWFDETKKHYPDMRHRALRHHSEAIYSSKTKTFEGIDYCSNECYINFDYIIKVNIPKEFSFESIILECEYNNFNIFVKTELEECSSFLKEIKNDINNQFYSLIEEFEKEGYTFLGNYTDIEILKEEFSLEGNFLTFEIKSFLMRADETEERKIVLNISDI